MYHVGNKIDLPNILFVGPLTQLHGQGIVTSFVYEIIKKKGIVHLISTHHVSNKRIKKVPYGLLILVKLLFKLIILSVYNKKFIIYFTPSRNFFGSNRDFFLLFILKIIFYFKKNDSIKIIAHLHGSELSEFLGYSIYGKVLKNLYLACGVKMIVLSKKHRELSLGKNYNNYIIIRNPVMKNFSKNHKLLNNYYSNGEVIKISFISNPIKDKGLKESINWCENFFKNVNWELNVVGWTNTDFKRVYNYGVNCKRIIFHGFLEGEKKYNILQNTHLLILNSKFEAQPLVVIEALLFDCVVILSNIEMLREFKHFSNVKFFTDTSLSERVIINLLKDKNRIKKSSQIASKVFSYERFSKKILNIFDFENNLEHYIGK